MGDDTNLPPVVTGAPGATDVTAQAVMATGSATADPLPPMPLSQPQTMATGGRPKEQIESGFNSKPERWVVEEVREIPTQIEVEKTIEQAKFAEPVRKEETAVKPIVDDYTQEILLKQVDSQPGMVTLPLTQQQVTDDLQKDILESVRWLAEWCVRQIKMLPGRVMYRK